MPRSIEGQLERYAQAHRARATWIVKALDAVDLVAKIGIVGAHDSIVVYAGEGRSRIASLFRWQHLHFAAAPEADAFLVAAGARDVRTAERDRLLVQGSPASYAHSAGISSDRLFWLVPSIDVATLRVADIRALAVAAREAGAILVVDNTVPTVFGCHPLVLGAHIVLEGLAPVVDAPLSDSLVAVSVAYSLGRRGRRRLADPRAEDAFHLLSFGLGEPAAASEILSPSDADAEMVRVALNDLAARMQPRFDAANAVASYLACHHAIGSVRYPSLVTHPDHGLAPTVLEHGSGPVVLFAPTGSAGERPIERCERLASLFEQVHAANLSGGVRPGSSAGASFPPISKVQVVTGTDPKTCYLRLYMGGEQPLSIVDSLDQALRLFCNPPEP